MWSVRYLFPVISVMLILIACKQPAKKQEPAARVLPFYNAADFTPQWIDRSSYAYNAIHTIPPFSFTNQEGNTVTEKTFAGKI